MNNYRYFKNLRMKKEVRTNYKKWFAITFLKNNTTNYNYKSIQKELIYMLIIYKPVSILRIKWKKLLRTQSNRCKLGMTI